MVRMTKKYLFFCLIALLIVSGCISGSQTQAEKVGWNQAEYDKYSKFYDKINNLKPSSTDSIEDFMVGMPQDTEFDKTWYLTFLYFKRGVEVSVKTREQNELLLRESMEFPRPPFNVRGHLLLQKYSEQSQEYFKNATEYRQKIEEMKPK